MTRVAALLTILCLAPELSARAAEPLRWKFQLGNTWKVKFDRTSDVVTTVGGTATKQQIKTNVLAEWKVESVDGENAVISQSISQVVIDIDFNRGQPLHFESSATGEPTSPTKLSGNAKIVADAIQPLLARKASWTVSTRGQVLKSENLEPNKPTDAAAVTKPANLAVNAAMLDQAVRQVFIVLPENAVAAGDTWSDKTALPAKLGKIEQATTFAVQPVQPDDEGTIRIASNSAFGTDRTSPPNVTVNESQQQSALVFNAHQGAMKSVQTRQQFTTTSAVKDTIIVVRVSNGEKVMLTLQGTDSR